MNIKNTFGGALVVASILLFTPGCQSQKEPQKNVKTQASKAKAVKPTSVTPPESASNLITTKKADPSRMPRDRIHAPFHKRGSGAPAGHMGATRGPQPTMKTDGHGKMPLPLKGAGGAEELNRRLAQISDAKIKARIDTAFRKTFTLTRSERNPSAASQALEGMPSDGSLGATAERIKGYLAIQMRKGFPAALEHYKKAVALDPKYGEAHYALAFTYVLTDRVAGKRHFNKAIELGVEDTRGLGDRFFK